MRLDNKVAIITGGSSGIGLAIAKRLASEGAKIIIASRDAQKGQTAAKEIPNSTFISTDVTKEDSVKSLIDQVIKQHGKIDILINNAGTDISHPNITKLTAEDYNLLMDTNFKSVVLMTKHIIPHLISSKGTIVNIGSQQGLTPDSEVSIYCASKAAVIMFTKSMAITYGKDEVRINCVCPGAVNTPLLKKFFTDETELKEWYQDPKVVPLMRAGEPDEIASIVNFLVSNEASYVTGAIWTVDGGSSL